ncbi:MAG: hypothetical protein LBH03_02985 [Holophagales bacterium]|nr:hypothetical protein [Holophagales bacterium]
MNKQGFGTLADLAQILEEASDPESQVREDRREIKPKTLQKTSAFADHKKKEHDPKRKAWYDRRLKEQLNTRQSSASTTVPIVTVIPTQVVTRTTAVNVSSGLHNALAAAKEIKPKDGAKRPEAWRRKPGDPIF